MITKPRVLFVAGEARPWGEAGLMLDIAGALHEWGAEVRLLVSAGSVPRALESACLRAPLHDLLGGRIAAWRAAHTLQDLGFKPDLIHVFDPNLLVQAGMIAWVLGAKLVSTHLHIQAGLSRARMAELFLVSSEALRVHLVNNRGVPKERIQLFPLGVSVPESEHDDEGVETSSPYDEILENAQRGLPLTGADTLLGRQQRTPWQIGSRYLPKDSNQTPAPEAPLPEPESTPVIAYKGPLETWARVATLLDALQVVKKAGLPFHALLIGQGPLRTKLGKQVQALDLLQEVTFAPVLPPGMEPFENVQLYVCPAECTGGEREILEAMAHGVAVIVTEHGGGYALLKGTEAGRLVPNGDAAKIGETLLELLRDREQREALGKKARKLVAAQHRLDATVRTVLRAYSRLLGIESSAPIELKPASGMQEKAGKT